MTKNKNYYIGVGLSIGTAIGGGIAVIGYAITGNPMFFMIAAIGTALGLSFGAGADAKSSKR